ncbi:MAG: hypothetical protein GW836_00770 [Paraglaciecola sp.]|nr:hypothetical protein [Paraglaciecola sp.]
MKKIKKVFLVAATSLLAIASVAANSEETTEPVPLAWYCKLAPFMCSVSTLGNGDGELPPKPTKG